MTVNWLKVERYMRRSIGGKLVDVENAQIVFYAALAEDPKRYRELHERLKKEAAEELDPCRKRR